MKFLVQFSRVLVALVFILSGLLKLNDPTGFSYKLDEYFGVFIEDVEVDQDSVTTLILSEKGDTLIHHVYTLSPTDTSLNLVIPVAQLATKITESDSHSDTVLFYETSVYQDGRLLGDISNPKDNQNCQIFIIKESKALLRNKVVLSSASADNKQFEVLVASLVKPKSVWNSLFEWCKKNALALAIFMSWLEAILGFALLIAWQPRFTTWMLMLLTLFFTFLTWYSWVYNKVTDCGCFGDALPLNPEKSFYKNIIFGVVILIILFGVKHIKPVFSNPFSVKVLTLLSMMLVGFSLYCKHYLPVVDFLHYSEGTDLRKGMVVPEGERDRPHLQIRYLYEAKDGSGKTQEVFYDSEGDVFTPRIDYSIWKYVKILEEKELAPAYEPPIHDFTMMNSADENELTEFFASKIKMLAILYDLSDVN
ncbi:MAG: putative membrane protein YphA (DoxX/SURF4 family), partial [Bacteroidia bacterium]